MATLDFSTAAVLAFLSIVLYGSAVIIRRLYFSPLSGFPGPKLTAATYLVEIYYDLFKGEGGQLFRAHRKWHEQSVAATAPAMLCRMSAQSDPLVTLFRYGPIVRINPDELHIQDSSWYETMYAPSRPVWKVPGFGTRLCNPPLGVGTTEDPVLYRARRITLDRFFAKRKIAEFGLEVQAKCDALLRRVEQEYVDNQSREMERVLNLSHMWECFAADLAVHVVFGQEHGTIASPNFHSPVNRAWEAIMETSKLFTHFPAAFHLTTILPKRVVMMLMPYMEPVLEWNKGMAVAVEEAAIAHADGKVEQRTLVGSLLQQNLPPQEAAVPRILTEAGLVVGAGVETVARTLVQATYHIIDQPAVRDRLVEELTTAIPNASAIPDWTSLSHLPYLSACVEEALRLTYGVAEKRTRVYDGGDLRYRAWKIPRGTRLSMSNYDVSCDESIFPEPFKFVPERWLGDPLAPDGRALSRYMVSFGKGMRGCLGIHLAYLELYVGIATFFRSSLGVRACLYDTDKSDVEMARDRFVPRSVKKSKGVRIVFQ